MQLFYEEPFVILFYFWFPRYHYLVKLLKMLIHRGRRCNYLRLLEKHCTLPISDSMAARSSSAVLEVSIAYEAYI